MIDPTTVSEAGSGLINAGSQSILAAVLAVYLISISAIVLIIWKMSDKHTKSIEKIFDRLAARDDSLADSINKLADVHVKHVDKITALEIAIKTKQVCLHTGQ